MWIKKYMDIICCPKCKGNLKLKNNKLICERCKKEYKIINNIPILKL
ncbi:Trm112 family protein [Methanocaldococcus sp.]